jgi:hypothetical protein
MRPLGLLVEAALKQGRLTISRLKQSLDDGGAHPGRDAEHQHPLAASGGPNSFQEADMTISP